MDFISLTDEQKEENAFWIGIFESKSDFSFHNPIYDKAPHVSKLFDDELLKRNISLLEYNLLGTYAINTNTYTDSRLEQKMSRFSSTEKSWYKNNDKLGTALMDTNSLIIHNINKKLGKEFDLSSVAPQEYKSMDFLQKKDNARRLDEQIYSILEKLSEEYYHQILNY